MKTNAITTTTETLEAWHWVADDRTLRDGDPVEAGRIYALPEGETPELCALGYHASERALDALHYAPGAVICRVRLSGAIMRGDDKLVAARREVLWMADATTLLNEFACDVAEQLLLAERAAQREPDARCWAAVEVKRRWMRHEATDEDLAAARDAAWDAAWDAARDAAWAAAWDAARDKLNADLETRLMALAPSTESSRG